MYYTWEYKCKEFCEFVSVYRLSREECAEEARCNYERYRTIIKNKFHNVSEENALKQIDVEEMYPTKKQKGEGKEKYVGWINEGVPNHW